MKTGFKKVFGLVTSLAVILSMIPSFSASAATDPHGWSYTLNTSESTSSDWVVDVNFGDMPEGSGGCTGLNTTTLYELFDDGVSLGVANSITEFTCTESDLTNDTAKIHFDASSITCDSSTFSMSTNISPIQNDTLIGDCNDIIYPDWDYPDWDDPPMAGTYHDLIVNLDFPDWSYETVYFNVNYNTSALLDGEASLSYVTGYENGATKHIYIPYSEGVTSVDLGVIWYADGINDMYLSTGDTSNHEYDIPISSEWSTGITNSEVSISLHGSGSGSGPTPLYAYTYLDDLNTIYIKFEEDLISYADSICGDVSDSLNIPVHHHVGEEDHYDPYAPIDGYVKGIASDGCHVVLPDETYEPDTVVMIYNFDLVNDPPTAEDHLDFSAVGGVDGWDLWVFENREDGGVQFTDEINSELVNDFMSFSDDAYFFYRFLPDEVVPTDTFGHGFGYGRNATDGWGEGYGFGYGYDYFAQNYYGGGEDSSCYGSFGIGTGSSEGAFILPVTNGEITISFPLNLEGAGGVAGIEVILPAGLTLKGASWDGTLDVSASTSVPGSLSGNYSSATVVTVDTGDVAIGLSSAIIVSMPFDGFDDLVDKLVMVIDGEGNSYTLTECGDQYTGSLTDSSQLSDPSNYSIADNTELDNSDQCYMSYNDVIYVATNHFTEFIAGEEDSNDGGNTGGGSGNSTNTTTENSSTEDSGDSAEVSLTEYSDNNVVTPIVPPVGNPLVLVADKLPVIAEETVVIPEQNFEKTVEEFIPEREDTYVLAELLQSLGADNLSGESVDIDIDLGKINSRAMYTDTEYECVVLALVMNNTKECKDGGTLQCLKKVYGLSDLEEELGETLSDKEIGDAIVFQKLPGEIVVNPRIVNLKRTVGTHPAILALSQPNDQLLVELSREEGGKSIPVTSFKKTTDVEGKVVIDVDRTLTEGNYTAKIYALRDGKEILSDVKMFTVDRTLDENFTVRDLEITKDSATDPKLLDDSQAVKSSLSNFAAFDSRFSIEKYLEQALLERGEYVLTGQIDRTGEFEAIDESDNSMVYLTYESIVLGSVVFADSSQKGTFKAIVPKELAKDSHKLSAFAYSPKKDKATSLNSIKFSTK